MKINGHYILSCLISALIGAAISAYFLPTNHQPIPAPHPDLTGQPDAAIAVPDAVTTPNTAKPSIANNIAVQQVQDNAIPAQEQALRDELAQLQANYNERTSKSFAKWIREESQASKNFNLREAMQERFNAEPIDATWSENQENKYMHLFAQNQKLAGYALTATECRSSQCELTISVTNTDQANQLLEDIANSLKEQNQFPFIIAAPDQQRGNTKIYVAKAADSFEFD